MGFGGIPVPGVTPLPPTAGEPEEQRTAAGGGACETKLRADVLSERTGRGNDPRLDLDLLRFTVQLVNQIVQIGMVIGISLIISWFERSSARISPLGRKNFFSVGIMVVALA